MSNEDTPDVPDANLADNSHNYDVVLDGFGPEKREAILANIAIIDRSRRNTTLSSIEIGQALAEIGKECHGRDRKFDEICNAVGVSVRMSQNLTRVAGKFYDVRDHVCDIPLNVLISLAAKATPKSLVEWVIQEKRAGRSINLAVLKGKLDAVRKKRPQSLAIHKSSSEKTAKIAPASMTDAAACSPFSQSDQVSDEAADAGATMSNGTAGPTMAGESNESTNDVVPGNERQPLEGQVLRLEEWTRVGAREDECATAAHNAADMLMNNAPVDRHKLAAQLAAADANELKKLLIERCSTAEAAE